VLARLVGPPEVAHGNREAVVGEWVIRIELKSPLERIDGRTQLTIAVASRAQQMPRESIVRRRSNHRVKDQLRAL
jgi:hypothetical protein